MMKSLLAGCAFVALAGCALGPDGPDYGDATHNNVATQSIQPNPPAVAQPVPGNGETAAIAQQRYAADHVKEPASTRTSNSGNVSNGGGGGSGGGGGGGSPEGDGLRGAGQP